MGTKEDTKELRAFAGQAQHRAVADHHEKCSVADIRKSLKASIEKATKRDMARTFVIQLYDHVSSEQGLRTLRALQDLIEEL